MEKVITVDISKSKFLRANPQWQYNHGQKLQFVGVELPPYYEVHFSNSIHGEAKKQLGDSSGVLIPFEYFQPGKSIYAWIYITDSDSGITQRQVEIPIHKKAICTDEEPTPEQSDIIEEAIGALNSALDEVDDRIETALDSAKQSGEFDGTDGNSIWTTNQQPFIISTNVGYYYREQLTGRAGSDPIIGDIVVQSADKVWAVFDFTSAGRPKVQLIGSIEGAPGDPGADGSGVWYTTGRISGDENPFVRRRDLIGREGAAVQVHDLLFAPDVRYEGEPTTLYEITSVGTACALKRLCKMKGTDGEDGTSPGVTITEIDGGHRITITDEAHPDGQSFDVMDGTGGSGTGDYDDLTNKPQIAGVTLSGDKSLSDLGVAPKPMLVTLSYTGSGDTYTADKTYAEITDAIAAGREVLVDWGSSILRPSEPGFTWIGYDDRQTLEFILHSDSSWTGIITDLDSYRRSADQDVIDRQQNAAIEAKYTKPGTGIPKTDLAAAVQTSLGKADDALPASGNAYRTASIPMGQLDSTSTATVMTAQVDGITELRDGVCVWLRNGVIASASGVTLNINSLGAKPIYNSLSGAIVTTTFTAASTYLFVYNSTRVTGGCWDMVYGYDTNTTYTPVKLGFGYATCSTAEATTAKTASLSSYTLTTGGIVAVKFNEDVPANATLNINSKGAKAIYYKGAAITAGVIKAGDTVTMIYSTYYHVLSIDRDIPSPSVDNTQEISIIDGYIGSSTDYARADHTHYFDITNAIGNVSALNIPVFLYDGQNGVYIPYMPQYLGNAYQHQNKMNFVLVVPPNYNSYPVLFTPSKFDTTTGELHLTGIVGGVLYEATLLPGADPRGQSTDLCMVGTMTTTNLALPSAQGVSF